MKNTKYLLPAVAMLVLLLTSFGGRTPVAQASSPTYTSFFPTASTTDARMLSIAGTGLNTLAGVSSDMEFLASSSAASFDIGIFDGNTGGYWDIGTDETIYTLIADPSCVGNLPATPTVIGTWHGNNTNIPPTGALWTASAPTMPDNDWWNGNVQTSATALATDGRFYCYHMQAQSISSNPSNSNSYKLASTALIQVPPDHTWSFMGAMSNVPLDGKVIYPNWDGTFPAPPSNLFLTTPTTYDGKWTFYLQVPSGLSSLPLWDGDFDLGSNPNQLPPSATPAGSGYPSQVPIPQCTKVSNPNTPSLPPFASSSELPYGSAGTAPGNPPDNSAFDFYRRETGDPNHPCVIWQIKDPAGNVYAQYQPSGNSDWELLNITGSLPPGTWQIDAKGLDLSNLSFYHFPAAICGVDATGNPQCPVGSIGDFVWNDLNGNGIQDAGELGIPNVTVNLLNGSGQVITTTTTDSTGHYLFSNLAPGSYSVQFVTPTGFVTTPYLQGSDTTLDSNANPANSGISGPITLAVGQDDTSWDAGFYQPASVGDFVWNDLNGNGIQDAGEPGIDGVTVKLLDGAGNVVGTTTTAGGGLYSFTNLPLGTYSVQFVAPTGSAFTQYLQGSDAAKDSDAKPDANPLNDGKSAQFNLVSGQNDTTWDAGLVQPAALGDKVWYDINGNGNQDTGEPGIQGVTVNLLDSTGTTVLNTTTTNASGIYAFSNLAPGTYQVQFTAPSGYTYTQYLQGGAAVDSNANPASSGASGPITLTSGQTDNTWDAGLVGNLSLGDFVWLDANGNGIQDTGEPGISGVTVKLLGSDGTTVLATATTGADGKYLFGNLVAGTYYVQFVAPSGDTFTTKYVNGSGSPTAGNDSNANSGGKTDAITLNADNTVTINSVTGGDHLSIDAGLYQPASVGDFVWNDLNGNGIQDSGEVGISGVTVTLLDGSGNAVGTTTTNGSGIYAFNNLPPGVYSVRFTAPTGSTFTQYQQGSNPAVDSNADTTTGKTVQFNLVSGQNDTTWDAGLIQPAALGDTVWFDANGDGLQNNNEPGIQGVTVNLLNAGGTTVITSTTTDASGKYSFANLAPGTYQVQFTAPSGYTYTQYIVGNGANTATDSNANPASGGKSGPITLTSGQTDNTWDAGLVGNLSLGDFVWFDANGNGIQDAGEPGISGVQVQLLASNGTTVITSTTTDANGKYQFNNLVPGTYNVQFNAPSGDTFTTKYAVGSTGSNDSNANSGGKTDAITLNANGTVTVNATTSDNLSIDAGLKGNVSLGDFVWNDINGNGIQDTGEPGIPRLTVQLLEGDGTTVLATTTTDANGKYLFNNLVPGLYYVQFTAPTGDTFTTKNASGSTVANDSNANTTGTVGKTDAINLTATDLTIDAGLKGNAALGDFVWNDLNVNGIQDTGETGIPNVTVKLLDSTGTTVLSTTTTDANGRYAFNNLVPGTYVVQFVLPSTSYAFTTPTAPGSTTANDSNANTTTGKTGTVTLAAGAKDTTIDAGLYQLASIGDRVWVDTNGNGIQDAGELGFPGATVNLLNSSGAQIATTTTNGSGIYSFTNLVPGTYSIQFVLPSGYVYTKYLQGTNTAVDSNANPANSGKSGTTLLTSGENDTTWDAGLVPANCTTGTGTWNFNAPLGLLGTSQSYTVHGLTITAYGFNNGNPGTATALYGKNDAGDEHGVGIASDGTEHEIDINHFVQLDLSQLKAAGVTSAMMGIGSMQTGEPAKVYGSNTLGQLGTLLSTVLITLDDTPFTMPGFPTYQYISVQAGTATPANVLLQMVSFSCAPPATASIGDFVWKDLNGNGIQDGGSETGIANVTVNLLNSSGAQIATTTTDANGKYLFSNLTAGTYQVQFVLPGGYVYTKYLQGSNTAVDSNANPANSGKSGTITLTSGQPDNTWDAGLVPANCTTGTGMWNFNSPIGLLGNSQSYTVNGLTITAYGFNNGNPNGTPTALYGKNDAGDEHGVGIASDVEHEIDINHFVQLDLGQLKTAGVTTAMMSIGSMQTGEPAKIYGSNTLGLLGSLLMTVPTTQDDTPFTVPGFPANQYISVQAANPTPTNVLLQLVSFSCAPPATGSIGDFVWEDKNANGIQDGVATPLPVGVTAKLLGSNGTTVIATTTTDPNGKYLFSNLAAGTYYVQFFPPTGYVLTQQYAKVSGNPAPTVDSNANPSTGKTDAITLAAGQTDLTIDAGMYKGGSIGDFVWIDKDGDGIQDTGELGIQGVTVNLLNGSGAQIATTTTDANGKYSFTNLAVGTYQVQFVLPSGYAYTKYLQGSNTAVDSNANPANSGKSGTITLTPSQNDTTWDAGLVKVVACVSGAKWSMNSPIGLLGNSQTYTANGLTVTAYGFNNNGTGTALYGKNDAGDEHGVGIASDGDHEIDINHFVQLDMSQLGAAGWTGAQLSIGSMQTGEPAKIYGSNTLGQLGTFLSTIPTTSDDTLVAMPGYPTYRYISVQAGTAVPANVLLQAVSVTCK